ncbi:hypothetical protein [Nguyenibacter sp. L1]|uniref:hypothetical protein n=1 Tax=Nguyenibacter sp. L1 TaxID=3049350 RepID=UPI002B490260|nr:hypothetical protein [Nguyenibacter sp. L1]WRH88262.1 hypothetical protein QN315_01050 [Nguyenibacter sp. L1]
MLKADRFVPSDRTACAAAPGCAPVDTFHACPLGLEPEDVSRMSGSPVGQAEPRSRLEWLAPVVSLLSLLTAVIALADDMLHHMVP